LEKIFHSKGYETPNEILNDQDYLISFKTFSELVVALNSIHKPKVAILLMNHHPSLLKILNSLDIHYCIHSSNSIPSSEEVHQPSLYINVRKKLSEIGIVEFLKKLPNLMSKHLDETKKQFYLKPKYIIAGGRKSINHLSNNVIDYAKVIWSHTLDYDLYLDYQNKKAKKNTFEDIYGNSISSKDIKNCIVFLDEYSPYHPDNSFFGIPHADKADTYFPAIEAFFQVLEKAYNTRVVIAAHPRSEYEYKNHFKNFYVIKNQTIELVGLSQLVLIHSSTSINYINLMKKNALFFYTSTMRDIYKNMAQTFARLHGKNAIEISINTEIDIRSIESNISITMLFEQYKENYIKINNSVADYSWNILAREFKSL
jgi:hypothetical protein